MTHLTIKLENECIFLFDPTLQHRQTNYVFHFAQCLKDDLILCGGNFEAPGRDRSFYKFVALKKGYSVNESFISQFMILKKLQFLSEIKANSNLPRTSQRTLISMPPVVLDQFCKLQNESALRRYFPRYKYFRCFSDWQYDRQTR